MNKYTLAYENKRQNNPRFKQSYVDYVAFLIPKIWEVQDVKMSPFIRESLARREITMIQGDIVEVKRRIENLSSRLVQLKKKNFDAMAKEEKDELTRTTSIIKRQTQWIEDLKGFKQALLDAFPVS